MKPHNNIEKLIAELVLPGTEAGDELILNDALAAYEKTETEKTAERQPNVWRIIMNKKITKFAAAAVVIIAVLIGLNPFSGRVGGTSVALADVAKRVEQITNCVFKKTTTVYSEDNETYAFDSLIYYMEGDIREDTFDNEEIARQVYVKFLEEIVVGIDHKGKVFGKTELTDKDVENLSPIGPKNFVNQILSKGTYKKLGRKEVDGVLSEGFEFNDKRAILSMDKDKVKNVNVHLWVDIHTNLPVRIELDAVLVNNMKAHVVQYDPQWDVELEADFFEPKIPAGYIKSQERGFMGINLENWPTLKVTPGMAAEKAGIKDGDVALEVNGKSISHIKSSTDAYNLLLGKIGEKVVLTIKRGEEIVSFEITREASADRN